MTRAMLLGAICTLLAVSVTAADPGDTLWTRTYGGEDGDDAYCVDQTSDGGYIIAGATLSFGAGNRDFYLVKTDTDGDTLWTRTYGGSNSDNAYCVQLTDDGGYVLGGFTFSFGAGADDAYLVKTDAEGDTLWTRTYGGNSYEVAEWVEQTADGGYIIAGSTQSFGGGGTDFYLVKTDVDGDTIWTRAYGGAGAEVASCAQQTDDGGYIVVGTTSSFGAGDYDLWLIRTDADGDTLWARTFGGSTTDWGRFVRQTEDGGYVVAGYTYSFGLGHYDYYLVKTDENGDTLWTRTYGGTSADYARCVQQTEDVGYIIAGYSQSFGGGGMDFYVVKTDENGDTLWTRTYGGESGEQCYSVQQTEDGGYVVAGFTYSFGAGGSDFYVVKTVPEGTVELTCDDYSPWFCRGKNFYFKVTVTNTTGENVSGPLTFGAYSGYDCDPGNVMVTIPKNKTFGPGVTQKFYFFKVPNAAAPGQYSVSVGGDLAGFELFCCMNTDIVQCGPWRVGDNTGWELLEVDRPEVALPKVALLHQNYPNPFNASTVIEYQLPVSSSVKLEVYNLLGDKVAILLDAEQEAGYKSVTWDASEVSSGVYFYKLTAGDYTDTKRMMLVK